MNSDCIELGDRHNFGKSVKRVGSGVVYKPRPVYLERLFLGKCEFRSMVNQVFFTEGAPSPFDWLPELSFRGADLYEEGFVEEIKLDDPIGDLPHSDYEGIGCVVALIIWFGVGDLHSQNILSGRIPANHKFVFTPVDIECALEKLVRPSEALLVPGKIRKDFCGLWPILRRAAQAGRSEHNIAAAIVHGFCYTMQVLRKHHQLIEQTFLQSVDLSKARVRVIPRDTKAYARKIAAGCFRELFACEVEQLRRGDIPYYFKYMDSTDIYFMSARGPEKAHIRNHQWGVSYLEHRNVSQASLEPHESHYMMLSDGALELLTLHATLLATEGSGTYKDTRVDIGRASVEVSMGGETLSRTL